jgi:ribosomal protein S18 acetylase RimI-like enzyme
MRIAVQDHILEIHPIAPDHLDAILEVYEQCEDFLTLCQLPAASMDMVLKDIEISKAGGGVFCGIYTDHGEMIGVIDYVPCDYCGAPDTAYLELLMIAAPYRKQGIGKAVVEAVENEIQKNPKVTTIVSGVAVNNPQAIQFWKKNGYQIVSEPKYYPGQGTGFDLRKDLTKNKELLL